MADVSSSTMTHTVHMQLKLDGKMFHTWREMTLNTLELEELDGAVHRPLTALSAADEAKEDVKAQHAHLIKNARRAYTIIMTSMSDELKALFISVPRGDAYRLWEAVNRKYESKKILNMEDCCLRLDERFDTYQSRLVHIVGRLRATGERVTESDERDVERLLLGLADVYSSAVQTLRINIKANNAGFDDACKYIRNGEEMMNIKTKNADMEGALSSSCDKEDSGRAFYTQQGYRGRGVQRGEANRHAEGGSYRDRRSRICYTCNEPGHVAFDCEKNNNKKKCTYCRTIGSHTTDECHSKNRDKHTSNNVGRYDHREYEY
jgi:hypothetical protein